MMKAFCIFLLLLLHVCMPSSAYIASPLIKLSGRSFDTTGALSQAAQILNVPEPGNWNTFMDPPSTTGSTGQAQVGTSTLGTVMAGWSIPEQFREQAIQNVNVLVLAAAEGSYSAQAFVFDTQAGTSLSTLIVITKRLDTPADPNSPVAVAYVTINTNAAVKQQFTSTTVRSCHRCAKCVWTSKCCCDNNVQNIPRGNTPDEVEIIKNKMKVDQFVWFNQQSFHPTLKKRDISQDNDDSTTKAIEKFLSSNIVKAEILASYNDSVLSALQSNIGSLKLSSQSLRMKKVETKNLRVILTTLSNDYGFNNIFESSDFSQQLENGRFSYENLFTTSINDDIKKIGVKYIWIVGERNDESTYSINFLFVNITSHILIEKLLLNDTNSIESNKKQIKIVRTAKLNDDGEFLNENLPMLIAPWKSTITKTVLNMLRYTAASILYPKKQSMLSYFNSRTTGQVASANSTEPRFISEKIIALSKAVSAAAGAWKDVVTAFKTSSSTTITRIVRFGFKNFNHKSTVLKAIDIPADKAQEFINAITIDYNLPQKGSFALGLTYSNDFAWDRIDYLYSPGMNSNYRSITLFKNGDSVTNTASFFIVDVNAEWEIAPDLLLIQKSRSILGGLFESSKQSIEEVPHVVTLEEATKLQQFFMLIATSNLAATMGINAPVPDVN
ncbi:hypothetical protein I4U23_010753 [Adineta vaga]|nr:hypothetical protein I4U23_010753 [Adineta vaga]